MKNEFEIYLIGPEGAKVQVLRKSFDITDCDVSDEIRNTDPGLDDPGTPTAHR